MPGEFDFLQWLGSQQRPSAFVTVPGGDDLAFSARLQRELVLVVPGVGFGSPGFFRIAYCVSEATLEKALPRFERALRPASG